MTTLLDTISTAIAALPVADRVAPAMLAYGVDMSCVTDLTLTMDDVDPTTGLGVAQMIVRRVTTPRGMVLDDLTWGIDLRSYVNRGTTTTELASIEQAVRTEVQRDDRVANAVADVAYDSAAKRLTVTLTVTLVTTGEDFKLVFFVTADGVQLAGSIDANG